MDLIISLFRVLIGGFLSLFQNWPPLVTLAPISLLIGVAMLWVFPRISNQEKIRRTRKRLNAHLYELRLFADEPRLIWRAQKGLLLGNVRYLALMLRPAVLLTVPMVILLIQFDAFYGYSPLPVGKPAIVTVQMKGALDTQSPVPKLEAPPGIKVETPALRVMRDAQISWRIRPMQSVSGNLRVVFPDVTVEKSIGAGQASSRYLSTRRVSSWSDLLWYETEKRLPDGPVDWIEIRYPSAEVYFMGFGLHWLIWFLVLSLLSALLLRKRFGVTI